MTDMPEKIISLKMCKQAYFAEYFNNHPILEEAVKSINKNDEIGILATGNNEAYGRNLAKRLNGNYKKISLIDPKFEEERKYINEKIEVIPKIYQEVFNIENESSKAIDLTKEIVKGETNFLGLEICSHQLNDIPEIERILKENNYKIKKISENMLTAKKEETEINKQLNDYIKFREKRYGEDYGGVLNG